ncbi:MAG: hypothetical protein Q8S36_03880 [Sulfuricurvum sp.]|nr:hypothetical protein [Sulfuricurvum sp.]
MDNIIRKKLEEIVALMNDPEITVVEKELKEKLEGILALLNNPQEITIGKQEVKEKLETVVALVSKAMVNPDIDIEYCIPEVSTTSITDPYILVKYSEDKYVERKIRLTGVYLQNSAEMIAKLVNFSIEQFIEEIDSVQMG